jgi:hypothetical protein
LSSRTSTRLSGFWGCSASTAAGPGRSPASAFKVDDLRGVVDRVRAAGWETVGEIVDFESTFLLCYVRGPEGLIVELAERLDGVSD